MLCVPNQPTCNPTTNSFKVLMSGTGKCNNALVHQSMIGDSISNNLIKRNARGNSATLLAPTLKKLAAKQHGCRAGWSACVLHQFETQCVNVCIMISLIAFGKNRDFSQNPRVQVTIHQRRCSLPLCLLFPASSPTWDYSTVLVSVSHVFVCACQPAGYFTTISFKVLASGTGHCNNALVHHSKNWKCIQNKLFKQNALSIGATLLVPSS